MRKNICVGREWLGDLLLTVKICVLEGPGEHEAVLVGWGPPGEREMLQKGQLQE